MPGILFGQSCPENLLSNFQGDRIIMQTCAHTAASEQLRTGRIRTYQDKSSTIHVAPMPSKADRVWLVQTASTRQPAATPDLTPAGASSTTMPGLSRMLQSSPLTVLGVQVERLGASKIWFGVWFTPNAHVPCNEMRRLRNSGRWQCFICVDSRGFKSAYGQRGSMRAHQKSQWPTLEI
jgi:hypothetical protein